MKWRLPVSLTVVVLAVKYFLSVAGASAAALTQSEINTLVSTAETQGTVDAVEAVETDQARALKTLSPQEVEPTPTQIASIGPTDFIAPRRQQEAILAATVVVLHGHFVYGGPLPRTAEAPSGSTFSYAVDESGRIIEENCCTQSPDLSNLGRVERVAPTGGDTARAAKSGRLTFSRGGRAIGLSRRRVGSGRAHAATWANGCGVEQHCYMVADWKMTGAEEVRGTQEEQDTASMFVPEWNLGKPEYRHVDDEEWAFSEQKPLNWVEAGQGGGFKISCCNLTWFYAFGYTGEVHTYLQWEVTFNTWPHYGMESLLNGAGGWCITIGEQWQEIWACYDGIGETSNQLEVGLEGADNEKPTNAAKDLVNARHMNGYYYNWNKAVEEPSYHPGRCWSAYTGAAGDINYDTC